MIRRLKRVDPVSCGKIFAAMYGAMSLLFVPFFLLFGVIASFAPQPGGGLPPGITIGMAMVIAVIMPVMYAVMGFVFGLLGAFVYNLAANRLGGIEVDVE